MKIKDLIRKLKKLPPETKVLMSRDSEGNGFSYLYEISDGLKFNGEDIGFPELTDELRSQGYNKEDIIEGEEVICLWPA